MLVIERAYGSVLVHDVENQFQYVTGLMWGKSSIASFYDKNRFELKTILWGFLIIFLYYKAFTSIILYRGGAEEKKFMHTKWDNADGSIIYASQKGEQNKSWLQSINHWTMQWRAQRNNKMLDVCTNNGRNNQIQSMETGKVNCKRKKGRSWTIYMENVFCKTKINTAAFIRGAKMGINGVLTLMQQTIM